MWSTEATELETLMSKSEIVQSFVTLQEFRSADILPVIWSGGKDFARLGGDDAAIYVKPSNLERMKSKGNLYTFTHVDP